MRYLLTILSFVLFSFSFNVSASTLDDIKQLEKEKDMTSLKADLSKKPNIHVLPNGKKVDFNDWQIVLFMQSTCGYCHKFDPVLKVALEEMKLPVFVFSFDGVGDTAFPKAFPVNNDIVSTFFRDIPVATPTTFLVNINNLVTAPVSQGDMSKFEFERSLDNAFVQLFDEGVIDEIK